MADWRLQLTEDVLRRSRPAFPTLGERLAAYEDFYFRSVTKKAGSGEEAAAEPCSRQSSPAASGAIFRSRLPPWALVSASRRIRCRPVL